LEEAVVMPRLIWLVLNDGRSVVAGCGSATQETMASALAQPDKTLTLTSDDAVEHIPSSFIRRFVLFEAKSLIPPASAIYRIVQV
jgi:hypothetical protein